jgi:hypothetical protein|tara:strand:- start:1550 stop:1678 length:129 start_codon:yes stop_codon:yes gene_type:complete
MEPSVLSYFNNILISTPAEAHGLLEFGFFMAVGITAGSLGII